MYWISWYQTTDDLRPIDFPPLPEVLGWWCSGIRCSDDAATICAIVKADSEDEAKAAVRKHWPEASEWRFCNPKPNYQPSDRFPLPEWSPLRKEPPHADAR